MIIILSPAKTFNKKVHAYQSEPLFISQAKKLIVELKKKSDQDLMSSMNLSTKLLEEVKDYIDSFGVHRSAAIKSYDGYAYKALDVYSLAKKDEVYLSNHLYILSGLYGLLRPYDGISKYRLELKDKGIGNLYLFWKKQVNEHLKKHHEHDLIIDLASTEYNKLLIQTDNLYHIKFYERVNDELKSISMHVKFMRGLMARHMMINRLSTLDSIKQIELDGYQYDHQLSTQHELIFVKKGE